MPHTPPPAGHANVIESPFVDHLGVRLVSAADGVSEVTLLGQNVNSYGRDLTTRLRSAVADPQDERLAGAAWAAEGRRRPRALFADLLRAVGAVRCRRSRRTSAARMSTGKA